MKENYEIGCLIIKRIEPIGTDMFLTYDEYVYLDKRLRKNIKIINFYDSLI